MLKPMLAGKVTDRTKIKFPVYATPKLDGIRCLMSKDGALSRKLIAIPNQKVQDILKKMKCPDGFDGELMIKGATFNETQSIVMSDNKDFDESLLEYHVFDFVMHGITSRGYTLRMNDLKVEVKNCNSPNLIPIYPVRLDNLQDLEAFEEKCELHGFEGVMIRSGDSPYKQGRSSEKEGFLLKIKKFEDAEARIVGFEEKMTNNNEKETDNLGHTKRSSKKANLVGAGTLGALLVLDIVSNVSFSIGSGFDDTMRQEIWDNQRKYSGKVVTYRHQPFGKKSKPRFPTFHGFRLDI